VDYVITFSTGFASFLVNILVTIHALYAVAKIVVAFFMVGRESGMILFACPVREMKEKKKADESDLVSLFDTLLPTNDFEPLACHCACLLSSARYGYVDHILKRICLLLYYYTDYYPCVCCSCNDCDNIFLDGKRKGIGLVCLLS